MSLPLNKHGEDNLAKLSSVFKYPNQPKQDSRVAYGGPITSEVEGEGGEEALEGSIATESTEQGQPIVSTEDDESSIRQSLADKHLTPGAVNIAVAILKDPTATSLARKIQRTNQDILKVVIPEMNDNEIAKAMEIISYGPDIRSIMLAVPHDRIKSVLSSISSPRILAIAMRNAPQSVPQHEAHHHTHESNKTFKVTIDGKTKKISAHDMHDALVKSGKSGKVVAIEEVMHR